MSAGSSPQKPKTWSTVARSNGHESSVTSVTNEAASAASLAQPQPPAPANSPEGTVVPDTSSSQPDAGSITSLLAAMAPASPPSSPSSSSSSPSRRSSSSSSRPLSSGNNNPGRGVGGPTTPSGTSRLLPRLRGGHVRQDIPLPRQLFKSNLPPRRRPSRRHLLNLADERGRPLAGSGLRHDESAPTSPEDKEFVPEFSAWAQIAQEDVERALKRMARLALDEHRKDRAGKTVEEIYSARLAELIKKADVKFDPKFLTD